MLTHIIHTERFSVFVIFSSSLYNLSHIRAIQVGAGRQTFLVFFQEMGHSEPSGTAIQTPISVGTTVTATKCTVEAASLASQSHHRQQGE